MPKKISTKYQHNNTIITPPETPVCHRPCPTPPFPMQRPIFAAGIPTETPRCRRREQQRTNDKNKKGNNNMTNEELKKILEILDLDYEKQPPMIYVFYRLPDGRINNYSISFHKGSKMSDEKLVGMMRRSSPTLRQTEVLGVERPDWVPPVEWLDIPDVCRLLRISRKTLWKWTKKGILNAVKVEGRTYYDRADIDRMIRDNAIEENGRLDKTVLHS
jgi:predicted DNA-binding transcriptional regulator AlpA